MKVIACIALLVVVCQVTIGFKIPGKKYLRDECGIAGKTRFVPQKFIMGGKPTEAHEYPWMAAVLYEDNKKCQGFLISDQWVITAAHCVDGFTQKYSVLLGAHNLDAWTETERRNVKVVEVQIHEDWDFPHNDIALLKLEFPQDFTDYIRPICLPTEEDKDNVFQGTDATVIGWGMTNGGPDGAEALRKVEVRTLKSSEQQKYCDAEYPSVICTSTEGNKGWCFGDNGSPLQIKKDNGRWTAIGAASFILKDCDSGLPNGYTRLTHNLDWIAQKTGIHIEPKITKF